MGMTMVQKVLASHSGKDVVERGEYVWAKVDGTGLISPQREFDKLGLDRVFDPDRVWAVDDHYAPSPHTDAAQQHKEMKEFARKYGLTHFFEFGRQGIQHQIFPEHGYVVPGDLIASADSHTTSYGCFNAMGVPINEEATYVLAFGELWFRVPATVRFEIVGDLPAYCVGKDIILKIAGDYGTDVGLYKAIEFHGPVVKELSMGSRFTMANMGVELGAKCAMFEADEKTYEFLGGRSRREPRPVAPDPDAEYETVHRVDVDGLEPQVALPPDPGNVKSISEVEKMGIRIDQAFLGACTNGRVEDIEMAVRVLRGRKVHPDARMIVTPASPEVWRECDRRGYWQVLMEAEAMITNPGCGVCFGGAPGRTGSRGGVYR